MELTRVCLHAVRCKSSAVVPLHPRPATGRCSGYTFYFGSSAASTLGAADDGTNGTASGVMEVPLAHTAAAAAVATGGLMMLGAATGGCGAAF
jgi:hypothetical protein